MPVKFVDDLQTRITTVDGIAAGATAVAITAGDGSKIAGFVDFASGDYCYGTFKDASGNRESVKITGRSTDQLTIERAQDAGDTARAWAVDDILDFCLCQAALESVFADAAAAITAHAADNHHLAVGTVAIFGQNGAPAGWTRKSDWQDNAMLCFAASGSIASGGTINPQSAHTHTGPNHFHTGPSHSHSGPNHSHGEGTLRFQAFKTGPGNTLYGFTSGGAQSLVLTSGGAQLGAGISPLYVAQSDFTGYTAAGTGATGLGGTGSTGVGGTGSTGSSGTGSTGGNAVPHYQEVIAATKDVYA